jgi:hypothetical protein
MDRDSDRAALARASEGSFGDSDYRLRGAAAQSRCEPCRSGDFHPRRGPAGSVCRLPRAAAQAKQLVAKVIATTLTADQAVVGPPRWSTTSTYRIGNAS